MNHRPSLFALSALALLPLAACGGAGDAPPATEEASAPEAPAQIQTAAGCFLARGTMEEAGERASPRDSTSIVLGGAEAKLCYGAPSARERVVMGELVPFGEAWRAGADEATGLHLAFPAEVAGVRVEPGNYALYTVPGADSWEVVVNGNPERWGIPIDEGVQAVDIGSGTVVPEATDGMVERLTYTFQPVSDTEAHLVMEWENTRLRIPVVRVEG